MDAQPLHGFIETHQTRIEELNAQARLFEHQATGARLLKIENDDDNKVFAVGFRTPPEDSTGVAHILEHSVLNGSRRYRTKEPFMDLVKGSLQTFLNAMTFSDKTLYPVASRNEQDFYNLTDVYLDAVFYPRIYEKKEIFLQEGWHYEHAGEDSLQIRGVVYNEMKGALSEPEEQVNQLLYEALYPNSTYCHNSGGDPYEIPHLRYEDFLHFHKTHYHPSNSYLYLYGNGDTQAELAHIQSFLKDFQYQEPNSSITPVVPFSVAQKKSAAYSIGPEEDPKGQDYLALAWQIGQSTDPYDIFMADLLQRVLSDSPASPIKKALLDAGIGEDIYSTYSDGLYRMYSLIAKNTSVERQEEFASIIDRELQKIAREGIDPKLLEASFNKMEFDLKESGSSHARGLTYCFMALETWLYGASPLLTLRYQEVLEKIREELFSGGFERFVEKKLLHNPHRVQLSVRAQPGLFEQRDQQMKARLETLRARMLPSEEEALQNQTQQLEDFQNTPDSEQARSTILRLDLEDVACATPDLPQIVKAQGALTWLLHEHFTQDILYVDAAFDAGFVEPEDIAVLSLLSQLLTQMSTQNHSYADLSNEIYRQTGGISFSVQLYPDAHQNTFYPKLLAKGRGFSRQIASLFTLFEELTLRTQFADQKRLGELLREIKASLEAGIYSSGHAFALGRARSYFDPLSAYDQQLDGLDYYYFLQRMEADYKAQAPLLIERLERLYRKIFTQSGLIVSLTGDAQSLQEVQQLSQNWLSSLSQQSNAPAGRALCLARKNEGIKSASSVQYVSRAYPYLQSLPAYQGSLEVLSSLLSSEYLHSAIRAKGGAYGAGITISRQGVLGTYSYRDPNLVNTLQAYDGMADFVENLTLSEEDLRMYIIGVINRFDPPLTSRAKGLAMLSRYITHTTKEELDTYLRQAKETTAEQLRGYAPMLRQAMEANILCALGNETVLEAHKNLFDVLVPLKLPLPSEDL